MAFWNLWRENESHYWTESKLIRKAYNSLSVNFLASKQEDNLRLNFIGCQFKNYFNCRLHFFSSSFMNRKIENWGKYYIETESPLYCISAFHKGRKILLTGDLFQFLHLQKYWKGFIQFWIANFDVFPPFSINLRISSLHNENSR